MENWHKIELKQSMLDSASVYFDEWTLVNERNLKKILGEVLFKNAGKGKHI